MPRAVGVRVSPGRRGGSVTGSPARCVVVGDGRERVRLRLAAERAGSGRVVVRTEDLLAVLAEPVAPAAVPDLDELTGWEPPPDVPADIPASREPVSAAQQSLRNNIAPIPTPRRAPSGRGSRVVALSVDRASAKRLAEAAWMSQPDERVARFGSWRHICEQEPWTARGTVEAALRAIEHLAGIAGQGEANTDIC
jgi:hypothetical protein